MFLHGTAVFDCVCESATPTFPVYFPLSCFYNILYSSLLLLFCFIITVDYVLDWGIELLQLC